MTSASNTTGVDMLALETAEDLETERSAIDSSDEEPKSRLLALPAELRNRTYELTVVEDEPISIVKARTSGEMWKTIVRASITRKAIEPSVSRVSGQLRAEVLPIFYGTNTFNIALWHSNQARKYAQCCHICSALTDDIMERIFSGILRTAQEWLNSRAPLHPKLKKVLVWSNVPKEKLEDVLDGSEGQLLCPVQKCVRFAWNGWIEVPARVDGA